MNALHFLTVHLTVEKIILKNYNSLMNDLVNLVNYSKQLPVLGPTPLLSSQLRPPLAKLEWRTGGVGGRGLPGPAVTPLPGSASTSGSLA